ncbi:hypothetical protein PC128_g25758 [Phytophthora cactorum]|nr:hypothetical protein PC128_g25758 [Phytophthora cactorum]
MVVVSLHKLKDAIKAKNSSTITCDAKDLQLFLAKKGDAWLPDNEDLDTLLQSKIDTSSYLHMRASWKLSKLNLFGPGVSLGEDVVHVLVVVPRSTGEDVAWSAKDLCTVDPDVQLNLWKSVVRVSSEDVCSGTALVVDQTPTHLYLMTNLHLWIDATFTDHLSADFKLEIKRYLRLHPSRKTNGRKRKDADVKDANVAMQPRRKSQRTAAMKKKTPALSDKPQIVVEQLLPDTTNPEEVHRFGLDRDTCWRSSAAFDFAIFEVPVPRNNKLVRCKTSLKVYDTMSVDVFGFPGALQDQRFEHDYAIIPAKITGWSGNQMTLSSLSAPGLSGSAIVCTKRGVPVGYIGGGLDGSAKNKQYQSYGFTFHGLIPELPSSLPLDTEGETKDEL